MRLRGGGSAVRALLVSLAVLLPAGVLAAASVEPAGPTTIVAGNRAGAASVAVDAVPADQAPSSTAPATSTSSSVVATVAPARSTTTTRPVPRPTSTTAAAVPASTAPPTTAQATTTTIKPQQSSWYGEDRGFTVRWTMQPAAPRVGEPVTFTVSMSPFFGCCLAPVQFDDGVRASGLEVYSHCDGTGTTRGSGTRTFAAPGYYGVNLAGQTFPCAPEDGLAPTDPMDPHSMRGVTFRACIEVAPRPGDQTPPVGEPGCPLVPIRFPF